MARPRFARRRASTQRASPEEGQTQGLRSAGLTPRETEVLRLIGSGLASKQVGLRLKRSVRTIEQHLRNIYRKTGIRCRSEATIYALQLGLLDGTLIHVVPPGEREVQP